MTPDLPIDREIASLREALADKPKRVGASLSGMSERTLQHFLAGGQPSVNTIRRLQSAMRSDTADRKPKAASSSTIPSEADIELDLVSLAARARYRASSIERTRALVEAACDRIAALD